jgi:hypothetical protein
MGSIGRIELRHTAISTEFKPEHSPQCAALLVDQLFSSFELHTGVFPALPFDGLALVG